MSSLKVQYLLRYLLSRRKALMFAKSSNCIRQFIPYLKHQDEFIQRVFAHARTHTHAL